MDKEISKKIYGSADYRSLTDAQRRVFRAVVAELDSRQLLRATDASVVASYSRNVTLARAASTEIEKHGVTLEQNDKYHGMIIKENPAVSILLRAQKSMEDTAIRLGLTPTGRKKLKYIEAAPQTDSEKWDEIDD